MKWTVYRRPGTRRLPALLYNFPCSRDRVLWAALLRQVSSAQTSWVRLGSWSVRAALILGLCQELIERTEERFGVVVH
jgi:hypothetical protein